MCPKLFVFVLVFFLAAPVTLTGQLFPFDRIGGSECIITGDTLTILKIDQHLGCLGLDSVSLEIYVDPVRTLPAPAGWAYKTQCIETCFIEKKKVAGSFLYPVCPYRRYTFLCYRDSCFVEILIELIPGQPASKTVTWFGQCPAPRFKKL